MKKFVAILLVVLPIFLLIAVSIAGMVLSKIIHINVESVAFVNENEEKITEIKLEKDESFQLLYKILPLQATDKKVTFISSKPDRVSITSDGLIKGLEYGMSTIIITTRDGGKNANIIVHVTDDKVSSVMIGISDATLRIGEQITLTAMVLPNTAINRNIIWSSSNSHIASIDVTGKVTAVAEGTVTITVTTVDGGKTDTCVITVVDETPILAFIDLGGQSTYISSQNFVDMRDVIRHTESVSFDDIDFIIVINYGASLNDGVLVFTQQGKPVRVVATIQVDGNIYEANMDFVWVNG